MTTQERDALHAIAKQIGRDCPDCGMPTSTFPMEGYLFSCCTYCGMRMYVESNAVPKIKKETKGECL